jgi:hypothetical protein
MTTSNTGANDSHDEFQAEGGTILLTSNSSSPPSPGYFSSLITSSDGTAGMPLKLLYYLISTMNLVFPDYDFSEIKPEAFKPAGPLSTIMNQINGTLFQVLGSQSKPVGNFDEFTRALWGHIDGAIGLAECEIYTFDGEDLLLEDEEENPFWEQGCMYGEHNGLGRGTIPSYPFIMSCRWSLGIGN